MRITNVKRKRNETTEKEKPEEKKAVMEMESIKKSLDLICYGVWMLLLGAFIECSRWGWVAVSAAFSIFFMAKLYNRLFR